MIVLPVLQQRLYYYLKYLVEPCMHCGISAAGPLLQQAAALILIEPSGRPAR